MDKFSITPRDKRIRYVKSDASMLYNNQRRPFTQQNLDFTLGGNDSDYDHISREDITSIGIDGSPVDPRFEIQERGQVARNQGGRLNFEDSEQAGSFIEETTPGKNDNTWSNTFYSTFQQLGNNFVHKSKEELKIRQDRHADNPNDTTAPTVRPKHMKSPRSNMNLKMQSSAYSSMKDKKYLKIPDYAMNSRNTQ